MEVDALNKKYICPICGYDKLKEDPYNNGVLSSFDICLCCGFEFGVTYNNELDKEIRIYSEEQAVEYYRKMWILTGALWFYEQVYERDTLPDSDCSEEFMKENPPIKYGYYRVMSPYDEKEHIYEYRGGIYAKDIQHDIYVDIMHFYSIAEFIG